MKVKKLYKILGDRFELIDFLEEGEAIQNIKVFNEEIVNTEELREFNELKELWDFFNQEMEFVDDESEALESIGTEKLNKKLQRYDHLSLKVIEIEEILTDLGLIGDLMKKDE